MALPNPLRESLTAGRLCYVVELVASRLTREARLLEVASQLARVPGVVAGSITSYAGGALGHDPIRVGTAARARGLVPSIHLTCVNQDRSGLRKALEVVPAERVFILPDCGCFHLPRDVAFAKLRAMVEGTRQVRKELGK